MIRILFLMTLLIYYGPVFSHDTRQVHIVSYSSYLLPNIKTGYQGPKTPTGPITYGSILEDFNIYTYVDLYRYIKNFKGDFANLRKIVFFDYCEDPKIFNLPKKKTVCFKWEAIKISPRFYEPYGRVYTFDDDLVDNKKFFKFYYPVMKPMMHQIPDFKEKKFLVMVVGHWLQERQKIARYFIKKKPHLEVYGSRVPNTKDINNYFQGKIPGYYSSDQKIETLSRYKFCICFENTHTTPGYITEKIFDCFAAGCVPIYWGPENVTEYIPKQCFIDYRDFNSYGSLHQFLLNMSEDQYSTYLKHIAEYLKSDKAYLFSPQSFQKLLYQEIERE